MARQQAGATYEEELAEYLQERIKPNLNSGSIPLLARSIARDLASRQRPDDESEDEPGGEGDDEPDEDLDDDEPKAEADDDPGDEDFDDEAEDEPEDEGGHEAGNDAEVAAFEDEMHELQADLGDDWIVRFSVQNDEAWLTAEKEDGSQHVEGPTADVLRRAVELLEQGGDRDT